MREVVFEENPPEKDLCSNLRTTRRDRWVLKPLSSPASDT